MCGTDRSDQDQIMRKMLIALVILIGWLIFAQLGLRRTISDERAIRKFAQKGIKLRPGNFNFEGHNLHYLVSGDDSLPVLLLLHGSPRSWTSFSELMMDNEIRKKFCLVAVDRPGYGQSDFGRVLHIEEQASVINALMDSLSSKQPLYIAGHSMGGPLVVALAAKRPGTLSAVAILAGALNPEEETSAGWRKIFFRTPLNYLLPGAFRPSNEESYNLKGDLEKLLNDFTKITCPVYLVHGTRDPIVKFRTSEWASGKFIHSSEVSIVKLDGAGHDLLRENYDEVKRLFLQME